MLAARRIIKQLVYVIVFLGLTGLLLVLLTLPFFDFSRRNTASEPKSWESIVVENIDTITHEGTVDIVVRVRNPNPRAGVPVYTVNFVLIDKEGNEIKTVPEEIYLLPGSLKYIALLDVKIGTELAKVRVDQPRQHDFVELKNSTEPIFSSFLREREINVIGKRRVETQKAIVTNTGNLGWRKVDVVGVAFDARDNVIGVGKTFIGSLRAGEQREITLQWPKPFADTVKVIILPDTNVYEEDNVLPVRGEAGKLRESEQVEETESKQ